ncbi:MAG: TolC family protein [Sandaracinaceae bacterium]
MPRLAPTLVFALLAVPSVALAQPAAEPLAEPPVAPLPALPAAPTPAPSPAAEPDRVNLEAVLRGEGRGLTAEEAAQRAVETAPSLDRARAAVQQASAGADQALYGFIPQLTLGFRYTRLSEIDQATLDFGGPSIDPDLIPAIVGPVEDPAARELWRNLLNSQAASSDFQFPVLLNSFNITASVVYPLSDVFFQVLPSYEAAQTNVEAMRHREDVARADIGLQAREAFYNYARARGALAVAQSTVQQARTRHEQVQAFVTAGTAAPVDELRLRAQLAAAEVAVARSNAGIQIAATAIRTLLHLDASQAIAVNEDVLADLPPLSDTPENLVAEALTERHDVRAVRRLIRATGQRVEAAEGSRYPSVALQANLQVANPNQRIFPQTEEFRESWDVSAVVQWSPHDLLNGEAQASQARSQQDQARADLRSLEDAVRLQVTEAAMTYEAARLGLEAARLGVEASEESYRVQMERYRAGASTVSDVIDASAEQLRAQLDLVNNAIDARVAWARLQRRMGAL